MHHYQFNIGDYAKKAGRLSMLQDGAYQRLMNACYDREDFPESVEQAIDWAWASTPEEEQAVAFVIKKFFPEKDGKHVNKRIEEELEKYREFCHSQSEKGRKGGRPKKPDGLNGKANGFSEKATAKQMEANPAENKPEKSLTTNHKPLTTNHKPSTKGGRMKRPTLDDLISEFDGRVHDPPTEAQKFLNHYESNGWKVGKNPMKSWKHAVTNWITRSKENETSNRTNQPKPNPADEALYRKYPHLRPQ